MLVTLLGMVILGSQPTKSNAPKSMQVTLFGIVKLVKLMASSKAFTPMVVTELGMA